jgi:hypothetical protein
MDLVREKPELSLLVVQLHEAGRSWPDVKAAVEAKLKLVNRSFSADVLRERGTGCYDPDNVRAARRTIGGRGIAPVISGISSIALARECVRTIAGWHPLPV